MSAEPWKMILMKRLPTDNLKARVRNTKSQETSNLNLNLNSTPSNNFSSWPRLIKDADLPLSMEANLWTNDMWNAPVWTPGQPQALTSSLSPSISLNLGFQP